MGKIEIVPSANPLEMEYKQLSTRFDPEYGILWTLMNPTGVPCYTMNFLNEILHHHKTIENCGGVVHAGGRVSPIRYAVVASLTPGVFNLGGQLELFVGLIRNQDRQALLDYGIKCLDVVTPRINHFHLPIITISLVQGDALGGGLESALSSDVIIAERSAKMGFPEILFNLFPGMGAYSLVARKIGTIQAEEMIMSGKIYSAEELHELGLVDMLVEDGEGEDAVYDYVRKQYRRSNGYLALQRARQRFNPVTYQELMDITTIWADAALQLRERDLKVMERFIHSQKKYVVPKITLPLSSEVGLELVYGGEMDRRKSM